MRDRERARFRRGAYLIPSLFTTGNLLCGYIAVVRSIQGEFEWAAIALFIAALLDRLDGWVARLTGTTSDFGVQFDSLADVISFGVAPAFLLYSFALRDLGRPAWFAAFLFVICGALRLARFNVITGSTDKRYFIGLPIPAGAAVACALVILLQGEELTRWMRVGVAVVTYLVSLLMVSTFRYWSFKEFDWARRPPVQTLLIVVLAGMIVATKHEVFLFLVFGGYAVSGPVRRLIVGHAPAPTPAEVSAKDHS